ncbi:MAG TPA: 3-deoxy-manno-octulosonate cytidylyltransferase [Acidobacteriota bacterium]|nr:3-deoxy-manno-octulosonate cytidylyltransferase [Acidobacteriota bacterium]
MARRRITADRIVGIIPARWGSTRFPGKIVTPIAGKPLLEWIIRGCRRSRRVQHWIVATDDRRIAELAVACGVEAALTPRTLKSGSDRVAHVVAQRPERWVLNWQGDEWLPDGRPIDRLVETLEADSDLTVATLARPINHREAENRNRVKVVLSQTGRALYFSRASIPTTNSGSVPKLLHVGAYLFERSVLLRFARWRPTPLERRESLEQLRLLEHDIPIGVGICRVHTHGVDTPADARVLARRLRSGRSR